MHHLKRYRVNRPNVVYEVMGGEAVIVNLDNGSYYSADGTGATIWSALYEGATIPQIVRVLHSHHTDVPENIEDLVTQWMGHLHAESLVAGEYLIEGSHSSESPIVSCDNIAEKTPFKEPALEKYTDMEDLLLLDPIHDVKNGAWPQMPDTKAS
jgi:hypothetical protein